MSFVNVLALLGGTIKIMTKIGWESSWLLQAVLNPYYNYSGGVHGFCNQPPLKSTEMNDRDNLASGIRPSTSMYYSEIQAN